MTVGELIRFIEENHLHDDTTIYDSEMHLLTEAILDREDVDQIAVFLQFRRT